MTNTFKGIRKNVETGLNMSTSARNIERLQRKIMSNLYYVDGRYETFVVRRVDVNEIGQTRLSYQEVGKSPVVEAFGKMDTETRQLPIGKEDSTGKLTDVKIRITGKGEQYKLLDGIILFSFKNAENFYEKFRIEGFKNSGKDADDKPLDNEMYYAVSSSASMGKKSKVFFVNKNADERFKTMNDLTGGVLGQQLDAAGQQSFDGLAKIASRVSLAATTPSLWAKSGTTNNVFFYNGSVQSANEDAVQIDVDNNFRDGYGIISDRFGRIIASELAGEAVTLEQARRMSWQGRVRGAAGKGHFRAYSDNQIEVEISEMMKTSLDKCFCWINGKEIDLSALSVEDIKDIAGKIDIIGDKDIFKVGKFLNKTFTNGEMLEFGLVNMSNKTSGNMGSQIAFKLKEDVEDAKKYFRAITRRQVVDFSEAEGKIGFDKNTLRLSNFSYCNCKNLNPDRAATDKLLNNYKIKQMDKGMLKKVINIKLAINSAYLRMVPEDSMLNRRIEVLGARDVDYVMPNGEVKTVRALEVYSSSFQQDYRDMNKLLATLDMTQEEKDIILNNMKVCTAIKSPSQGDNEFEVFVNVTDEDLMNRKMTKEMLQFFRECPYNTIIIAQDNTVKHQLAGSDFDGDDVTVIYPEFSLTDDNKLVTGLEYEGEIINCYTSMIVRKRVRDNNTGVAALIVYGMNESVDYATEEEKKEEAASNSAEYLQNMDIQSLLN